MSLIKLAPASCLENYVFGALLTLKYLEFMHQSIPAVPIPPPGNRGAFAHVVSRGGGAFAIYRSPGGWALAYPGANPGHLTHVFSKHR